MNKALIIATLALTLGGCASDRAFREGERLLAQGQTEAGLQQLQQALKEEPNNAQYRTAYIQAREAQLARLFAEADAALQTGRDDAAEARYRDVLKLHAENPRARAALVSIETLRANRVLLKEARTALDKGEVESARGKLRSVLAREPAQADALALMKQVDEKTGKPRNADSPRLAAIYRRPVTLQFRDAPVRTVFDALSRQSGLNFVFDKDVRTDTRLTIFASDTSIVDALDMLLKTGQLGKKVLSENTLLIYPALPAKLKEYQDLVVKGFFLSNTDAKQMVNLVRSMAKTRDVYIDEKLNLLVIRDTPEAVRLVEKLVALADRPEPEVMLEVEILEVKRTRLQELGIQYPNQLTVLTPEATTTSHVEGGVIVTDSVPGGRLTIQSLRDLTRADIGVSPNPAVNLRKDAGDVNILANPRIRVKNKEKAKIHIGDKVPVITANVTSTGVTSESVSYLDVGIKVDVEPQVYLEGDVGIKVGLEVSNIVQQIKSATGTLTYQLGSRNANTVLRLKDGETQVLAGLISDEDRSGASKVPLFGDIPLLGRLFSNNRDELSKTEIVLLITPRIVRNIERPELADSEFFGGTESAASDQSMQLRSVPGAALGRQRNAGVAPVEEEPVQAEPIVEGLPAVEGVPVDVPAVPPMQPPEAPIDPAR
ncbi:MAG: type II secretion system protein D [Gammaproteobacteria bacterium]|jgi:general secretion pathway protein D|nr:type II secretion system protein D [Gammaproteobacteria bacterium]MBU1409056.1 type II secretion system protein D [Gammaproteobacteria bacterium]MBU1533523.1 type II secretion system protein D [Gammaproteobacteria bacterium]